MRTRSPPQALPADASPLPAPAGLSDPALAEELLFLEAWERGLIPWPGVTVRVRQIRRANPALAAAIRPQLAQSRQAAAGTNAMPAGRTGRPPVSWHLKETTWPRTSVTSCGAA